jgi:hypothetical protein
VTSKYTDATPPGLEADASNCPGSDKVDPSAGTSTVVVGSVMERRTPSLETPTVLAPTAKHVVEVAQLTPESPAPGPLTPGMSTGVDGTTLLIPATAPSWPPLTAT